MSYVMCSLSTLGETLTITACISVNMSRDCLKEGQKLRMEQGADFCR